MVNDGDEEDTFQRAIAFKAIDIAQHIILLNYTLTREKE